MMKKLFLVALLVIALVTQVGATQSVWLANTPTALGSTTQNIIPTGASNPQANNVNFVIPIGGAGTITKLKVNLATAPGSGKTRTFTLNVNGSDDANLTVTYSDTESGIKNATGSASVSQGDEVYIKSTNSGTPDASTVQVSMVFDSTASDTFSFGNTAGTLSIGTTDGDNYIPLSGYAGPIATLAQAQFVVPTGFSGYIVGMSTNITASPGSGETRTFAVSVNGTDNTTDLSSIVYTGTSDTGKKTVSASGNGVAITGGDKICIHQNISGGGTAATSYGRFSLAIKSSNAGEFIIRLTGIGGYPSASSTVYTYPSGPASANSFTTQALAQQIVPTALILESQYFWLTNPPLSGRQYTFTTMSDNDDTTLSAVIAGASDTTATVTPSPSVTVAENKLLCIKSVPQGTPAATGNYFRSSILAKVATTTNLTVDPAYLSLTAPNVGYSLLVGGGGLTLGLGLSGGNAPPWVRKRQ